MNFKKIVWIKLRLVMGFVFFWAFIDKVFGLGFATTKSGAWINGGSPTTGFLSGATEGPLASFFQGLAGVAAVDWLFMAGLAFVGITLLINRYVVFGSIAGMIMMILTWLAIFPPENNPIIDEHIVYALVFAVLAVKSKEG